jgi:hypothetical protein
MSIASMGVTVTRIKNLNDSLRVVGTIRSFLKHQPFCLSEQKPKDLLPISVS